MVIVAEDKRAVIVTADNMTELEQYATEEFQKYIARISGIQLQRVRESELNEDEEYMVLIGRSETCKLLSILAENGYITLSAAFPGDDSFIIKVIKWQGKYYLILGGSNERGVIYSVYHFLENILNCGFFEDGENIPFMSEIIIDDNINIAEKPYFPFRGFLQGCTQVYTTPYWDFNEWQYEIDWLVKKKINLMYLKPAWIRGVHGGFTGQVGYDLPARRTWKTLGIDGDWNIEEDEETHFAKAIIEYARKRGIRIVNVSSFNGEVPNSFKSKYPDCKYLVTQWEVTKPSLNIDPSDPMFAHIIETYIREYNSIFGTDHRYEFSIYSEMVPGSSREEAMRLRIDFAKSVVKGMKAADPDGIWQLQSWCFLGHPDLSPDEMRRLLSNIPHESIYICDTWGDAYHTYERYDYFYGKTWGFSVLHAMAGNTTLHGDIKGILQKVKRITVETKAGLCRYFTIIPEVIKHNILYYELLMRLSWNPREIDIEEFLNDYAMRRYGKESAGNMIEFLNKLLESVYSTENWVDQVYQLAPGVSRSTGLGSRFLFIDKMREALNIALKEKEKQISNPLYLHDLVDVCRQYLGDLFNYHWVKLEEEFDSKSREGVERESKVLCDILDRQASLLSLHPDYRLTTEIRRAENIGITREEAEKVVKARFTYLGLLYGCSWDEYPFLLDYARRDLAELIKYYYLPRVKVYLEKLKDKLDQELGKPIYPTYPSPTTLSEIYKQIAYDFIEKPLPKEEYEQVSGLDGASIIREIGSIITYKF